MPITVKSISVYREVQQYSFHVTSYATTAVWLTMQLSGRYNFKDAGMGLTFTNEG